MSSHVRNVCVIEDDRSFLSAIMRLIRMDGYSVLGVSSLEEFRNLLPLKEETCVVTDIMLSGESGLDVPAILHEARQVAPVIFISATDDRSLIKAVSALSSSPVLRKPIEAEKLFDALRKAKPIDRRAQIQSHP